MTVELDLPVQTTSPARTRAWWRIPLYPTAFPVSFVLLIWGNAVFNVLDLVRPLVVAVAISVTITLVVCLLAGDRRFGGIGASAVLVGLVIDRPEATFLLFLACALVILVSRLRREQAVRAQRVATGLLQLVAVVTLLATVINAAGHPGFWPVVEEAVLAPPGPAVRPVPGPEQPDIFVYLLDGYPGAAGSAKATAFDAGAFPSALTERGFTVHADSRTNYLITRMVLPTMFEGRHAKDIPALAPPFGPEQADDARRLRLVLETSSGLAAIRGAGYDVVWVSAGWSHVDPHNVDRHIGATGPDELELAMIQGSAVGTFLQAIDPYGYADVLRARIKGAFETAASIAATPGTRPRFVFIHVPAPHAPAVFRADGSPEDFGPTSRWDYVRLKVDTTEERRLRTFENVQAVGDLALAGLDALRSSATRPPVIVVFSDHGTDVGYDPGDPLSGDLDSRSSTFLATLTPGHPDLFAAPTTPVNIIGILTNAYMGTDVPRQPDVTFAYDGSVLNVVPVDTAPGD
jgi:hypothetical protein